MRVVLFSVLALTACQTPCPAPDTTTVSTFRCEDGSDLRVTFQAARSAVVEQEGYTTLSLPARVAGTGFRFSANGAELRGRAAEVHWTRPGAAETLCSQIR